MDRKVIGIVNHDEWVISDFHSVTSGVPQNHCSGHNYLQPILMILTGYALKKNVDGTSALTSCKDTKKSKNKYWIVKLVSKKLADVVYVKLSSLEGIFKNITIYETKI